MARKTPPVREQVVGPYVRSNAYIKGRLIDFDTGSAALEGQHKRWLSEKMAYVKSQSGFHMWLIGFASKIGDANYNKRLSNDRTNAVLKFIGDLDDRALNAIELWEARGEEGYKAAESDNSADMRAVEVHIFIGDIPPPPPPPDIKPNPRPLPPLPGGQRYSDWAVASPGGAVSNILPGVVIGFNVFVFRNRTTGEQRAYIAPSAGFGQSLSLKGGPVAQAVQTLLTSPTGTNMDFEPLTSPLPVTWDELGDSLSTVSSIGAGGLIGPRGVTAIHTTIEAPSVWRHSPSGVPIRKELQLFSFDYVGRNFQVGAGGSAVVGPLVEVAR